MIIDSHAHVVLPPECQLEMMAQAGVDRTVLFPTMIYPETAKNLEAFEREMVSLYEILNGTQNALAARIRSLDELAQTVKANPGKYLGFGSMPLGLSVADSLEWAERYIVGNGFKGIGELAPGEGKIALLEPVFQASANAGNLPLWIHTFFPFTLEDIKELLVMAKRYSDVPVIMGHMGGIHWLQVLKAIKELPNVYLDLSAAFTTMAPGFAIREYPEKVLFASDAPYSTPLAMRTMVEQLVTDKGVLERVMGGNIAGLLDL
jgi:predicted TIM-barrel fold metal-dependent hydrolase